jgi:hypothetical protein
MWLIWTTAGVVLASLLAVAGLLYVRRSKRFHAYLGENEVPGFLFGGIGVLYGALLGFVVFGTWESYAGAEQAVTTEAAQLVGVYRDSQIFPPDLQTQIQASLRNYANTVMATEWASHGNLVAHTTPDLLNPVWDLYRQWQPTDAISQDRLQNASQNLHELELQRHLRHLSGEQALPGIFWPVLLVGSVLLIVFSYFFKVENVRVQAVTTALVAAMLSLTLLLIYSLNSPFTGPIPVSQQPLQHALAQFDAIDLPATTP